VVATIEPRQLLLLAMQLNHLGTGVAPGLSNKIGLTFPDCLPVTFISKGSRIWMDHFQPDRAPASRRLSTAGRNQRSVKPKLRFVTAVERDCEPLPVDVLAIKRLVNRRRSIVVIHVQRSIVRVGNV